MKQDCSGGADGRGMLMFRSRGEMDASGISVPSLQYAYKPIHDRSYVSSLVIQVCIFVAHTIGLGCSHVQRTSPLHLVE